MSQNLLKIKPIISIMHSNTQRAISDGEKKRFELRAKRRRERRAAHNENHGIQKGDGAIRLSPDPDYVAKLEKTLEEFKAAYLPMEAVGHKISELMELYFSQRDFNRKKTEGDKRKSIDQFIDFSGDFYITEVNKLLANQFFIHVGKTKANATLIMDRSSLKLMFEFADEMGWIADNPFGNINLRNKGKKSVETVTFTPEQLQNLFALDIPDEHHLCFALLAATGARLDEITLLKWPDIKTEIESGIVYLDLTDPTVPRKNKRSRRKIPLPTSIKLPQKAGDLLFSYRIDVDGKAQNAASRALMKFVKRVRVSNERLVVHSLRHTYKDMLRAIETPEDVANAIMGHTPSNEGGKYGSGHNLQTMLKCMDQIDLKILFWKPLSQIVI